MGNQTGHVLRGHVTWAEYQELPDDGNRYEVLEGELVVTPAPEYRHQATSINIAYPMETWRRDRGDLGRVLHAPFDVILAYDTIVQPDIIYLSERTLGLIKNGRLSGAPDVAVEIFNARGAARDRVSKLQVYSKYLIKEYWLVDLDAATISMLGLEASGGYSVFASGSGDTPLASRVMEGFVLRPRDAFQGC